MATGATPATGGADGNGSAPDPDARFPTGPNGRMETVAEMEHRLAVDRKMRFHRSLQSSLHAHMYIRSCVWTYVHIIYIYIYGDTHEPR